MFSLDLGQVVAKANQYPSTYYRFNVVAFSGAGNTGFASVVLKLPTVTTVSYTMPLSYLQSNVGNPSTSLIDPTVLSQSSTDIYQFMLLGNPGNITLDQMNAMLKGQGVLEGQGQAFLDAAAKFKVSPIYLAAHAILESGNGTSKLATGKDANGNFIGYYNVFGIGAYDSDPITGGNNYAKANGWNSVYNAIYGGAQWINANYIWGSTRPQYTLYMMRWDPGYYELTYDGTAGSHQPSRYATDVNRAHNIAGLIRKTSAASQGYLLHLPFRNSAEPTQFLNRRFFHAPPIFWAFRPIFCAGIFPANPARSAQRARRRFDN